jgi:hypothetical protein
VNSAAVSPDPIAAGIPDPYAEIRLTTLHATRGANFWSTRPVTRMDLCVGAFDDISSAELPGFVDRLVGALPGLADHECSLGMRGGFVIRLRRGTYAPHIVEHVALELQTMVGHEVGYGRTRGGDTPGEYTIVFEHEHDQVGLRAAGLALAIVQGAISGTLERPDVDAAVAELTSLSQTPCSPAVAHDIACAVTGGAGRSECVTLLRELLEARRVAERDTTPDAPGEESLIVDVSPSFILQAGLPYASSDAAVVLDTELSDVPERYREAGHAQRLVSTVADGVRRGRFVVCPAKAWEVQDYARDQRCRVAIFATDDDVTRRDLKVASAVALVRDGRICFEGCGDQADGGPLRGDIPTAAQVAAGLAAHVLTGACGAAPRA